MGEVTAGTRIKLCGLSRPCDIEAANRLLPSYIGFVFAPGSRRYVSPAQAAELKGQTDPRIAVVGVFVNERPETVADLLCRGIIDWAQLHGQEDGTYIRRLRTLTDRPLIQAFRVDTEQDAEAAEASEADMVLLDSGRGGTGRAFDWSLVRRVTRPYLLAGGLNPDSVGQAMDLLHPWGVDVSSGIETDGKKDMEKMRAFVYAVRGKDEMT
jgi:phosphoribosylanthranilate isomerase